MLLAALHTKLRPQGPHLIKRLLNIVNLRLAPLLQFGDVDCVSPAEAPFPFRVGLLNVCLIFSFYVINEAVDALGQVPESVCRPLIVDFGQLQLIPHADK